MPSFIIWRTVRASRPMRNAFDDSCRRFRRLRDGNIYLSRMPYHVSEYDWATVQRSV